jgi:alpha-N-arabinofuranosidase
LRTEFSAPDVHYQRDGAPASFWGLNGSASRKGNVVTLTMVNPALTGPYDTQVSLRGATIASAAAVMLASSDMHAHNTFEQRDAVKSAPLNVTVSGELLNVTVPAASVTKLEITLA